VADIYLLQICIPVYLSLSLECQLEQLETARWIITVTKKNTEQSIILAFSEPLARQFLVSQCGTRSYPPDFVANRRAFKTDFHAPPEVIIDGRTESGDAHNIYFVMPEDMRYLSLRDHSFQHFLLQRLNWGD
jgi:hypothetical protein